MLKIHLDIEVSLELIEALQRQKEEFGDIYVRGTLNFDGENAVILLRERKSKINSPDKKEWKFMSPASRVEWYVENFKLPDVLARRLAERYNIPPGEILEMSEDELRTIRGIGQKRASELFNMFTEIRKALPRQ